MLRAFSDNRYDYYELTQSLGYLHHGYILPEGSIFVHDKNDSRLGSISSGCLKLCWTPDGNCYGSICGGAMMFHAEFRNTDLFKKVQVSETTYIQEKLESLIEDLEKQLNDVKKQIKELNI